MTDAAAQSTGNRFSGLYAFLVILNIALVWILPHFPTQDGPSHLYNLVILHDLVNGGKEWGSYFTYGIRAVPDLGFHLLAYPLITLFSPSATEKIFVSVYILLMTVSVPVFLKAFGKRAMPVSFLVFPLLFNFPFMMGFYSFSLAVPCMLLAISAAWKCRTWPLPRRFVLLNLIGLGLFFLHLIPFIIYLLSVFIMLTIPAMGRERPFREVLLRPLILTPSVLLCLGYLAGSRSGTTPGVNYTLSLTRFQELLGSLFLVSTDTFSRWQLLPWIPLFLLLYLLARTAWKERNASPNRRDRNRTLVPLLLVLLAIYFTFPVDFGGGDFFNQRFPWILALLALPLLEVPSRGPVRRWGLMVFPGIALLFLFMNSVILKQQSSRVNGFLAGMRADIPHGSFIATIKPVDTGWTRVDPLLHAASWYGIEKHCIDAGNYELASAVSFVRFREPAPVLPRHDRIAFHPERIDWSRYPAIRFILGWTLDERNGPRPSELFNLVMREGRFTLWQRRIQRETGHRLSAPESTPR